MWHIFILAVWNVAYVYCAYQWHRTCPHKMCQFRERDSLLPFAAFPTVFFFIFQMTPFVQQGQGLLTADAFYLSDRLSQTCASAS